MTATRAEPIGHLLDEVLPGWDARSAHNTEVAATPEAVWEALAGLTLLELPVTAALMSLRTLPAIFRRRERPALALRRPLLETLRASEFVELGRREGREVVLGAIGRFWSLAGNAPVPVGGREEFEAFDRPGYARAAMAFRVDPSPGGARLSTETRVDATDEAARREFLRYWRMIEMGGGLIRREMLRAIRRRAERQRRAAPAPL